MSNSGLFDAPATSVPHSDRVLDQLQKYMPMVMVKNGLRAAVNPDCAHLVDRVSRVEFLSTPNHASNTVEVVLNIWWELDEGEHHVSRRKCEKGISSWSDPVETLEELTTFQPEDVLKYAAFV